MESVRGEVDSTDEWRGIERYRKGWIVGVVNVGEDSIFPFPLHFCT